MPVGLCSAVLQWSLRLDGRADDDDDLLHGPGAGFSAGSLSVTPHKVLRDVGVAAELARFLRDAFVEFESAAVTECPELVGAPSALPFASINVPNAPAAVQTVLDRLRLEVGG